MIRDQRIRDTGWVASNHSVQIEKYDDEVFVSLIHPPCCPSMANEHLFITHPEEARNNYWAGIPLGAFLETEPGEYRIWECMADYESTSRGLLDGWGDDPYGDTLDPESVKVLDALADGTYDVEIEFGARYGWSEDTWIAPSEYEWAFYWRFVGEPRES